MCYVKPFRPQLDASLALTYLGSIQGGAQSGGLADEIPPVGSRDKAPAVGDLEKLKRFCEFQMSIFGGEKV